MSSGLGTTPPAKKKTPKRKPRNRSETDNGDSSRAQLDRLDRRLVGPGAERGGLEAHRHGEGNLPRHHGCAGVVAQADLHAPQISPVQPVVQEQRSSPEDDAALA